MLSISESLLSHIYASCLCNSLWHRSVRGNFLPVTVTFFRSTWPFSHTYFVIWCGTHGSPSESSPDSIIFVHSSLIASGVGVEGAEISPSFSFLFLAGIQIQGLPSSLAVSIPDLAANSLAIWLAFLPGMLCFLAKVVQLMTGGAGGWCCKSCKPHQCPMWLN